MDLTAERSLEIITEQIERSRKSVSQDVGMTLLISGLCIVGVAIIVIIGTLLTNNWLFYLLYMLIPVFIWAIERYVKRNKPKVPASVISTMVDKTWQTFGIFVVAFFVLSIFYNNLMLHDALSFDNMQIYFQNRIESMAIYLRIAGWYGVVSLAVWADSSGRHSTSHKHWPAGLTCTFSTPLLLTF